MQVDSSPIYVAVVDDDETLCRSYARLLRAAGMQPITYVSAEAFLADAKHPRLDCLVLDIQLTGMSGLALQRQLAVAGVTVPIVFITAHDEAQARARAFASGCAGFFRKTDSGNDVLEVIRRVSALSSGG
jgi:FixJ family two-component response regulator